MTDFSNCIIPYNYRKDCTKNSRFIPLYWTNFRILTLDRMNIQSFGLSRFIHIFFRLLYRIRATNNNVFHIYILDRFFKLYYSI